jgi:ribonuclease BN (tRNA processing enzyme)
MGLSITVLGSCGTYPVPDEACSGYLVRGAGATVWLDAGPGTLANLQRHVRPAEVDAVVLSHAHADHWTDVLLFYNLCRYVEPRSRIPVFSPAEVLRLAREVQGDVAPTFDWFVVAGGDVLDIGGLRFTFSRTDHPAETLAARIDGDGRSLGYTADTGPAWALSSLGPGLDLAVVDATFLGDQEGSAPHLSARQAGMGAKGAGVDRLVLTHRWPTVHPDDSRAEAEAEFGGAVEMAAAGEVYEV